jgi:enoyl-CoA hydratase
MGEPLLHLTIEGDVARVELDKPPVNAFDLELVEALAEAIRELAGSNARAVVFSGRGPSLAAGGDIKWMVARTTERDGKSLRAFFRGIQGVFDDIDRLPVPTIAVVHGTTLGGGLELALACDLRVAAQDARIGFPEAGIGLIPAAGGTQRLTEIVGRPLALELMYTGRVLDAQEAKTLGLVNRVAPAEQLQQATQELLDAVLRSTPAALAAIKNCVRTQIEDGRSAGFRLERQLVEGLAFDGDAVERLTDFVQRKGGSKPQPAAATATGPEGA